MKSKVSFLLYSCLLAVSLYATTETEENNNSVNIYLSNVELQEIFNNPEMSYVYLGKDVSYLSDLVDSLCTLDTDESSYLFALKKHMETGFKIGRADAVLQTLEYAQDILNNNDVVSDTHNVDTIKNALDDLVIHIRNNRLTLNSSMLSFLKDSVENTVDTENEPEVDIIEA